MLMMRGFYLLLIFILMLVSNTNEVKSQSNSQVYIVYMGSLSPSAINAEHAQLLSELVKRKKNSIMHVYHKSFLGFAARLSKEEAESIAQRPGVVSVFADSMLKLHTTHSWDFLMGQTTFKNSIASAPTISHSNVSKCLTGCDTIIGIIDTGIWSLHPSFDDKYMGSIPQQWKGICMTNDNSSSFKCNRKVIGARYYDLPDKPGSITTAMDEDGHGTHTASTAAGMPVYGASYYGLAEGVARGGSPCSRIAAYRVCGDEDCPGSSILKAFDDAINDGVDVISASLGSDGVENMNILLNDPMAIGAFHAEEVGITVVASVGNNGPDYGTVENISPWILSVGATTMDRDFQVNIVLGDGNGVIKGGGINFPSLNDSAVYDLVDGRSVGHNKQDLTDATNCIPGSLDDARVKGKIVLCMKNDSISTVRKIDKMMEQGVIGVIIINDVLRQITYNYQTTLPFAIVSSFDGAKIQFYIDSTRNPLATILPTKVIFNYKPAPVVAVFSSRGPPIAIENLLKPDVTAPGVAVLAASTFNDTSDAYPSKEAPLFNIQWGTSMSCPHVSGLAAIIKFWHSTWTPSAIRSAIMTTAIPTNNYNLPITTVTRSRATPYDIGSGEISLFNSLYPGLVYETKTMDYILFLCNMGYNKSIIKRVSLTLPNNFDCPSNSTPDLVSDLNYPSIVVSGLTTNVKKTVKRSVTNVGQVYSTFKATVEAPSGVQVQIVPNNLRFTKNVKTLSFQVTFMLTTTSPTADDMFGSITWSNNFHNVRSPFVVRNS